MTLGQSLRKNAHFLISGFTSAILVLGLMRWSEDQPLIQPASDVGVLIGAVLVAGFIVFKDLRAPNGNKQS